jgi:hypothetical protein
MLELEVEASHVHVFKHIRVEAWILMDDLVAAPTNEFAHVG